MKERSYSKFLDIQQPTCINDIRFEAKGVLKSGGSAIFTAREVASVRGVPFRN